MKHLLALSLLLLSSECFGQPAPVVHTNSGPVRGEVKETFLLKKKYLSFRGIPYAKPPLGDLRYQPPVPAEPWQKILNATKDAPACPQIDEVNNNRYVGDEDCLYINVFSPITSSKTHVHKKAVMLWIYGGSFNAGSSLTSFYGPDMLVDQDIVLVTFNYRLGALGFLSLSRSEALGNAGMKDQVLAMHWVQQNIAKFGGDPRRVTIFGESAGSAAIHFQVLSPLTKGLYVRAIAMSGSSISPWAFHTADQAMNEAKKLANYLGSNAQDSDALWQFYKNAPAKDLVNGSQYMDGVTQTLTLPFRPSMELNRPGAFITDCPISLYKTGRFNKVPLMMGQTKEEALGFTRPGYTGTNDTWTEFDGLIDIGKDVFDRFAKGSYDVFLTDYYYTAPTDLTRKIIKQQDSSIPIYSYIFEFDSPYAWHRQNGENLNGTAHADDLQYVFHNEMTREPTDPNDPVNLFRRKVSAMWANFAKCGNPTPPHYNPSNVVWEESGPRGLQMNINTEDKIQLPDISPRTRQMEDYMEQTIPAKTGCTRRNK
ncbi:juvenile hormone esterase [Megalopta genalis]|uniref:juvenile hormone esterase n=1 Tax=Megalopta genalis TaxID=115081 RepID=UPI003FD42688